MKKYFAAFLGILAGMAFTATAQQAITTNSPKPATQQTAGAKMAANKAIDPTKPNPKKDPKRVQMAKFEAPKMKTTAAPAPTVPPSGK